MFGKRSIVGAYSFLGLGSVVTPLLFINKGPQEKLSDIKVIDEVYEDEDIDTLRAWADEAIKKMNDYSFRIFFPCGFGTGWILDYEIPTEKNTYPTKWYIATNVHVLTGLKFFDNDYEQELPFPVTGDSTKELRDKARLSNPQLGIHNTCELSKKSDYFDFNLSRQETGEQLKSNYGAISSGQMKEPKLFYAPINFLEEDQDMGVQKDNYKDFAVIEVEFTSQEHARAVTGNFYKKYPETSNGAINVFAPALYKGNNWKEIEESYIDYYSLAYPQKQGDLFSYTTNFDEDTGEASFLSTVVSGSPNEKPVRGHISVTEFEKMYPDKKVKWNKRSLNGVGHFYSIEHGAMVGGASGGLVIDREGNILGIKTLGDWKNTDKSLLVPLRSNKIINGSLKTPEYDLILGGIKGQKTSYKQQVENYILKNNRETWLSRRGNWKQNLQSVARL